jgi:hypothetical protein
MGLIKIMVIENNTSPVYLASHGLNVVQHFVKPADALKVFGSNSHMFLKQMDEVLL